MRAGPASGEFARDRSSPAAGRGGGTTCHHARVASPSRLDPREVLGVGPRASADEITAAYRRAAKRWHPDRADDTEAADRMALVNAAYAELREAVSVPDVPIPDGGPPGQTRAPRREAVPLDHAARRTLGPEMASVLDRDEQVELVTATATWASPQSYLAVTDRRILWLLDDVPVHRVRSLKRSEIAHVATRPARFWRGATITVEDRRGRRYSFGELPAPTAEALVRRLVGGPRPTPCDRAG